VAELRWVDGKVRCPYCGSDHVAYPANVNRYKCYGKRPKVQFSLTVGSIMEDSPVGLDKWLTAMWLIVNCKNGISSCEIARDLSITQKLAWHLAHGIRKEIKKHVGAGSALYTDALLGCEGLASEYAHCVIDHAVKYVHGQIHTKGLENFWVATR
jgi:transposase-like protein